MTYFYWEDLDPSQTHDFTAVFTPTAAGTPQKDILEGSVTAATWGQPVNFGDFKHRNAMFTVKLKAGGGYGSLPELENDVTEILLEGFAGGNRSMKTNRTAILIPLTALDATHKLKISVSSGATYTLDLNTVFLAGFEGNNSYTLEATVNKSKIENIVAIVGAWNVLPDVPGQFGY